MRGALSAVAFVLLLPAVHAQQPAPAAASGAPALDFEFFRTRVEPILLHKREGLARCYSCHSQGTPLVIERLSPGATTWTEEQSRKNFEVIRRVVSPGNPQRSRLLLMPLAREAGGVSFHPGGKHWTTRDDPEFRVLAEWVSGARAK
jgi:hypothetical protein